MLGILNGAQRRPGLRLLVTLLGVIELARFILLTSSIVERLNRSDERHLRRVVRNSRLLHCLEKVVSAWLERRSRGYASADLVDLVQG